jgi:hypothetical protein
MKEPELLEDYAARLRQEKEFQPMRLSAGGGPLKAVQPMAARGTTGAFAGVDTAAVPRPTPRPSRRSDFWVQLTQPETVEYGVGYGVYGTDLSGRQGTHGNAQYGEPRTMQVIDEVARHLAKGPEETPFEVGNISLEGGKSFKGKYGHNGHMDGLSIDVRPARRQGAKPGPLNYRSADYDREATRRLLKAFIATGQVDRIYFNDPDIDVEGVYYMDNHDDHFHVQLKR